MTSGDESIRATSDQGIPDHLLESTSNELQRLKLEVIQLKSDLDIANARASFYEDQAGLIKEIVKGALRTAFVIKQNAEKQAQEITNQAQEEKLRLQEEIASLVTERERVREELNELQQSLNNGRQQRSNLDLQKEQLRNDLDALDERLRAIRAAFDGGKMTVPSVVTSPESENELIPDLPTENGSQEDVRNLSVDKTPIRATQVVQAATSNASGGEKQSPGSSGSNGDENGHSSRRRLNLADFLTTRPGNDIELIVSSLHGFPKLVEFERALHEFAEIKNFYVRDFRNGIARLVVRLKDPNQRQELQHRLESLPSWNISVTSSEPSKIEMKVTS